MFQERTLVELKATISLINDGVKGSPSNPSKEETRKYGSNREAMNNKYAAMREQNKQASTTAKKPVEQSIASAKVSLLDGGEPHPSNPIGGSSSGLASKWESMKNGFQSFKANIGAKKFLPLRQIQETNLISRVSSSESLDEIFQKLKRPSTADHGSYSDEDDVDGIEIKNSGSSR